MPRRRGRDVARAFRPLLLAILAFAPRAASAQEPYVIPFGARVGVRDAHHSWEGDIQSYSADSLTLLVHGRHIVAVPRQEIRRLVLRTAKSAFGRHVLTGAACGAGVGAILGFALHREGDRSSRGVQTLAGAGSFACLGAMAADLFPSGEEWTELPLDGIRVGIRAGAGHDAALTVAMRF